MSIITPIVTVHRHLHVTKGHALFLDDALIPVEFLVDHRSIVWDDRAQEVELYRIGLTSHDVLLASGVAAESYRDDDNRWLFQNAHTGWDQPQKPPCAPILTSGPLVDAVLATSVRTIRAAARRCHHGRPGSAFVGRRRACGW